MCMDSVLRTHYHLRGCVRRVSFLFFVFTFVYWSKVCQISREGKSEKKKTIHRKPTDRISKYSFDTFIIGQLGFFNTFRHKLITVSLPCTTSRLSVFVVASPKHPTPRFAGCRRSSSMLPLMMFAKKSDILLFVRTHKTVNLLDIGALDVINQYLFGGSSVFHANLSRADEKLIFSHNTIHQSHGQSACIIVECSQ